MEASRRQRSLQVLFDGTSLRILSGNKRLIQPMQRLHFPCEIACRHEQTSPHSFNQYKASNCCSEVAPIMLNNDICKFPLLTRLNFRLWLLKIVATYAAERTLNDVRIR